MCFNGGRLGPLDAKTYVKASLAFQNFCQHLRVLMVDVKHRWPLKFFQHLRVLMVNVKALLAFEIFANTYVF